MSRPPPASRRIFSSSRRSTRVAYCYPYTREDLEAFLSRLPEGAALRREELCLLDSEDLDPGQRTLRIKAEHTKNRLERVGRFHFWTPVLATGYYRTMQPSRLSILGVGLLGGSIGLAAKSAAISATIVGYGHRPQTLRRALESGAIDEHTLLSALGMQLQLPIIDLRHHAPSRDALDRVPEALVRALNARHERNGEYPRDAASLSRMASEAAFDLEGAVDPWGSRFHYAFVAEREFH